MKFQTKRMLRQDNEFLRTELASLKMQFSLSEDELALAEDDRQLLVDLYWSQKSEALFSFHLQLGLVLVVMMAVSAVATIAAFITKGFALAVLPGILTAFFGWMLVMVGRSEHDVPTRFKLPSGEVVEVSPAQIEATHRKIVMMAQA